MEAATEYKDGLKKRVCGRCGEEETTPIPALGHTHNLVKTDQKPATCTEAGNKEYWTCSGCGLYFGDAEGSTNITEGSWVIPATGHTPLEAVKENEAAATCTEPGSYDLVVYCDVCGTEISREAKDVPALGHTMTHTAAKEATCTEAGNVEYWTCGTCKKHFRDEAGTTEITEADLVVSALGHDLKATAAKAATCTEAGNNAYWTCSRCGLYFGDAEGSTNITEGSWVIPATGHTPKEAVKENETAATCTEAGSYDMVVYCDVCGEELSRETTTVPALGHTMTHTEAKAATCTEAGNVEYWTCGTCKKHFSDEAGTTEIAEENLVIAALGHDLKPTAAKEATCTEEGSSAYWTCSRCGLYFGDEEGKTPIAEGSWIIAALGHDWGEWEELQPATESENGLEKRTCGRCGEEETNVLPALGHTHNLVKTEEKPATCTEAGNKEYWTCSGCGLYFGDAEGKTQIEEGSWIIAAPGHDWSDWSSWKAAEGGTQHEHTRTCSRCGETETEKADHTWQEDTTITTTFQDGKWTGSRKRTCTGCQAEETFDALITPLFVDLYSDGDEGGMTGSNVLVRDDKFLLDTATVRDFMEDHGLGAFYSEDGKLTWEEEHPEEQIEGTFTLVNETDGNINFTEYLNAGNTELTIQIHFKPDTEYSSRYAEADLTLTLKLQKPPTITITWICRKDENDEGTVVQVNEKLKNGITIDELQKPDASKLTFYGCEYKWIRLSPFGDIDPEGAPFWVDYETLPEVTYYTLVTVWTKDHTYGNPGGWELSEDKTKAVRKKTCTTCGHQEIAEEAAIQKVNIGIVFDEDGKPKLETVNGKSYVALDITGIQSMAADPDSGFTTLGEGEELILSDITLFTGETAFGVNDGRIENDYAAGKITFLKDTDKQLRVSDLQEGTIVTVHVEIIPDPNAKLDPADPDYAEKSTRYRKFKGGDYELALCYLSLYFGG